MNETTIKIEANSEEGFPFTFYIEKAVPGGTEEEMTIKGVASTTNIDHDSERMSESSLHAMADIINERAVPLRLEHQKEDDAILGSVNKAWVDSRNQLWIEANLDKSHPGASMLYKALKTGSKLGLSVGGRVKHAVKEFSESAGKMIKTFYNVVLDEVSVTSRPANYDAWLVSKSIISEGETGDHFVDSPIYKEFLFETPVLDYLQSFAKSIPDKSWKKVNIIKNNENKIMSKDEIKKGEKETTEEEKEKAVVVDDKKEEGEEKKEKKAEGEKETEETSFKSMVTKTLEGLTAVVAKLAKSSDKEETTIMEEKTESKEEEKEKSEEKKDDNKEEVTSETKDYHIKSMDSLLKRIENLSKAMEDSEKDEKKEEKKEKSEEKKEDETTEKSEKTMEIDQFVDAITKSVTALEERFAKGGKRTLGLTSMIVNAIRNDKEIQKEIQDMIKQPGFKKSMQFGIPMMRTKDGKAYQLTATVVGESVEKSSKDFKGKTFKEVYNKDFSSSAGNSGE